MNYPKLFPSLIALLLACTLSGCVMPQRDVTMAEEQQVLALIDQGTALLRKADFERAEAAFEMALDIEPIPQAYDGLGCVAFLTGKYEIAEQYFVQALQVDPEYVEALGNLALLYESQGLTNQANELYQRALQTDPGNFRIRNNFAGLLNEYVKKGAGDSNGNTALRRKALAELRKAEALAPHPIIRQNIAASEER